jgi:hypothetical protein
LVLYSWGRIYQQKKRDIEVVKEVTLEDEPLKLPVQGNTQKESEGVKLLGSGSEGSSS